MSDMFPPTEQMIIGLLRVWAVVSNSDIDFESV